MSSIAARSWAWKQDEPQVAEKAKLLPFFDIAGICFSFNFLFEVVPFFTLRMI
jgi:hypothetical protein